MRKLTTDGKWFDVRYNDELDDDGLANEMSIVPRTTNSSCYYRTKPSLVKTKLTLPIPLPRTKPSHFATTLVTGSSQINNDT